MWDTLALAEEQTQHFDRISKFLGEEQSTMDSEANDQQAKQERLRMRWTPNLDKIFADIVVEQIQLGNRSNNVFEKKTWNLIREDFNRQTNLSFNNNQLRKHLDVLRTRYHNLQPLAFNMSEALHDPCYVGFDLWDDIGMPSKIEPSKTKECPIYDQLSKIFADSAVDGEYAQSSHYEELDRPPNIYPSCLQDTSSASKLSDQNGPSPQNHHFNKNMANNASTTNNKRKRSSEVIPLPEQSSWNQDLSDAMAEAISEMINCSGLKTPENSASDERFSISSCVEALDEIRGVDDCLYYTALDLFENPSFRETFISLKSDHARLMWLQGNCGNYPPPM